MQPTLSIFEGIMLGFVQGITEFLPVSSSGHLVLAREFLQIKAVPLLFDVLLHVATLFVIVFHYRNLILQLCAVAIRFVSRKKRFEDERDLRLIGSLLVATVLTVIVALLLRFIGASVTSVRSVAICFILTALLLISTKWIPKAKDSSYTWGQAILIGIAQGFGTLAGISRSGITLSAALWSGMQREQAGEYAFILSIPAVLGALILSLADLGKGTVGIAFVPTLLGGIVAFLVGLAALRLLLWMVKEARLWYFSFYLIAIGLLGLFITV